MVLSALATIASFLPYLAIYFIIQEIVGAYPDFDALDVPRVLGFGGMALGGVLLNVLLYAASVALSHIAAYGTLYQCKINYVSHITKLPLGYHLKMGSGRLRKIMDDNIESLEGFIAHDLPNMISAFVAPFVMLVLVFVVDWRFGLAAFAGIIFSFLIYGITSGGDKTKKLMEDYQTSLEDMSNASKTAGQDHRHCRTPHMVPQKSCRPGGLYGERKNCPGIYDGGISTVHDQCH